MICCNRAPVAKPLVPRIPLRAQVCDPPLPTHASHGCLSGRCRRERRLHDRAQHTVRAGSAACSARSLVQQHCSTLLSLSLSLSLSFPRCPMSCDAAFRTANSVQARGCSWTDFSEDTPRRFEAHTVSPQCYTERRKPHNSNTENEQLYGASFLRACMAQVRSVH